MNLIEHSQNTSMLYFNELPQMSNISQEKKNQIFQLRGKYFFLTKSFYPLGWNHFLKREILFYAPAFSRDISKLYKLW